ncbi:MAG: hypothetical protein IK048_03150 [Clostridia bacterium]|nr:hypothetical protein [Clostridia bacterium]
MTRAKTEILRIIGIALVSVIFAGVVFAIIDSVGTNRVAEAYESYFDTDADLWEDGVFTEYSTGLYWYASGNPIPRRDNPVDKTKPTLIFAHGMKTGEGYKSRDLLSLWFSTNTQFQNNGFGQFELEDDYYQILIDAGYNVGQFYWSQIADDDALFMGDKKIWSSTSSADGVYLGTRYVVNNGSGSRVLGDQELNPNPDKSVAVIFGDAIRASLGADYGNDLHLVGHSMGGQLVLATGEYLCKLNDKGIVGEHLIPNQVTLVDPYFGASRVYKDEDLSIDHLDGKLARKNSMLVELAADAMETLARRNVAIDAYGGLSIIYRLFEQFSHLMFVKSSSGVSYTKEEKERLKNEYDDEMIDRLSRYCVWTYLDSLAGTYGGESHCMIIDYYFSTLSEPTIATDNYGVTLPSAKASKEYILSLRGKAFRQSLATDKEGENPFYMHNSAYTRTNAVWQPVSDEYTAFVPFPEESKQNIPLIIGLSVGGGVLAIGVVAIIVVLVLKKKKLQQ